jgi:hypothetical protein
MHDLDEFFGRRHPRVVAVGPRIDHVLANVVLDDFRNKPIHGASAGGGLLQNIGAFLAGLDGTLDRLYLTAQASDPIQKFGFLFGDVAHAGILLE